MSEPFIEKILELTNPKDLPRFVWDESGRGIWDNQQRCWVVWNGIGGRMHGSNEFIDLVMKAINLHPDVLAYRTRVKP
jgi:hypothetical protein